jgi:hypothetical protein
LAKQDLAIKGYRTGPTTMHPPCPGRHLNPIDGRRRPILGQTGTKVRRLRELGYDAAAIAGSLMLEQVTVEDFLARLTPLRRARVEPDKLTRPRSHSEDRAARRCILHKELRQRIPAPPPPAGWTTADRSASTANDLAGYARFLAALRHGTFAPSDVLHRARAYYAPPRDAGQASEASHAEPAIWTGPENPHVGSPKLSPEVIAEIIALRSQGWSTGKLAKRYGVSRATICYAYSRRTFSELQLPPTPPFIAAPLLKPAPTTPTTPSVIVAPPLFEPAAWIASPDEIPRQISKPKTT